jgi:hypothetical protein
MPWKPTSGFGVGSIPTAALALSVLAAIRLVGEQIKEAFMSKTFENSKFENCVVEIRTKLTKFLAHFFETIWAFGVSVAAAMALIPNLVSPI